MPQDFACKWLLIMGFIAKFITRGQASLVPLLPPQPKICEPFVTDKPLKETKGFEFSSPGYYDHKQYPNQTDCVRVLTAPAANQIISLDFRDDFHIEPSNACGYDFLELRDGPYGFSPEFRSGRSKHCGKEFPMDGEKIFSSGPFLWVRFHSDSTIQHRGFKAVYEIHDFRKNKMVPKLTCREPVSLEDASKTLSQHNYPAAYLAEKKQKGGNIDCTFDISSKKGSFILIHFDQLNFTRGNTCGKSYVEIYDGYSLKSKRPGFQHQFCKTSDKTIVSTFNRVIVRTFAQQYSFLPFIQITITALSPTPCKMSQYQCKDKKYCIRKELRCNKKVNCPGLDDEQCKEGEKIEDVKRKIHPNKDNNEETTNAKGKQQEKGVPYHYIILGIIGALLCFFILICMFITVRQRRVDLRNRRREELLRRSSDDQRYLQQQQHQQQQQQQQSPHSLRRDMHTPSSLEGNRLMDLTQRPGPSDSASLGRLTKQNGAVMMGASPGPKAQHATIGSGGVAATSSSAYYDPRAVHSTRVGKYLAVPNPPAHPDDEELCLGISPVEHLGPHRSAYDEAPPSPPHQCEGGCGSPVPGPSNSQARCKVHGEVYHRDGSRHAPHQPIIHRSDSAPSKAFFRVGSVTPPPGMAGPSRLGAATPPSYRQHQQQHYDSRSMSHQHPEHPQVSYHSSNRQRDHYYRQNTAPDDPMVSSMHRVRSQPYTPAPAYSLHNLPVAIAADDDDSAPCICRHYEPTPYPARERELPSAVVRQASLGTPRSLRRKIYET